MQEFKAVILTEPLYGLSSVEEEQMQLLYYYKLFEKYLPEKTFRKLIGMLVSGRRYHCPYCTNNAIEAGMLGIAANYALLEPNEPNSTELKCWICEALVEIERRACTEDGCEANVVFPEDSYREHVSNCCLKCCSEQDS